MYVCMRKALDSKQSEFTLYILCFGLISPQIDHADINTSAQQKGRRYFSAVRIQDNTANFQSFAIQLIFNLKRKEVYTAQSRWQA